MRLHWHRRDLRLADNVGLADPPEPPAGVFVLDDEVIVHAGPPRVAFLLESVERLRTAYRERGSTLFVRRGDPADVLAALADEHGADVLTWNRDYSGLARRRDHRVDEALAAVGISVRTFHDALCHEPGSITTNEGEPYSVYSYFWRKWRDRETDDPRDVPELAAAGDDRRLPTV
jgi:deoxyribodipyrimidine photo-lyase